MTSLTLRSVDIRPTEAAVWTLLLANPQLTELHCDLPAGAGLQQQVQLQRQSLQARRRWLAQFLVELSLSRRQPGACRWAWLPLELWAKIFGYLPWGIYQLEAEQILGSYRRMLSLLQ